MAARLQKGTACQCLVLCDVTVPSASACGGDPLGQEEMVELVCAVVTQPWGGLGAPAGPFPWAASIPGNWHIVSSWDMPASS